MAGAWAVARAARRPLRDLVAPFSGGLVASLAAAFGAVASRGLLDGGVASVVAVPPLEESLKALVLLAVVLGRPERLRAPAAALATGAAVGLGFSVAENAAYALADANAWGVLVARSVTSTPIHATATALVAAGASLALRAPTWRAAALVVGGVLLHAAFNAVLLWAPTTRIVGELYTRGVLVVALAGLAFVTLLFAADRLSRTPGERP